MTSSDLFVALSDGAALTDTCGRSSTPDLRSILLSRLSRYYERLHSDPPSLQSLSLEQLQFRTSKEALSVIERVQKLFQRDPQQFFSPSDEFDAASSLGTKDLAEIRTLLSITFKWGLNLLLSRVVAVLRAPPSVPGPEVTDLTPMADDYQSLCALLSGTLRLLFPLDVEGKVSNSYVTTTIFDKHAIDLLNACLTVGWLPKSLSSDVIHALDIARASIARVLNLLTPCQAMTALASVMSQSNLLPHVRKSCASFLSQQLLRPQGIRGLCAALFPDDSTFNEEAPMEKLQHITHLLITVPAHMNSQKYFNFIIPRVIEMLSPHEPSINKRAACYIISRVLSADNSSRYHETMVRITLSILHAPFLAPFDERTITEGSVFPSTPSTVLPMLITLVSNADPSPMLISNLLSPVAPSLYSLLHFADSVKTFDPTLTHSLRAILTTWGKLVDRPHGVDVLWGIVGNEDISWKLSSEGFCCTRRLQGYPSTSLTEHNDLEVSEADINVRILNSYPDPCHFVEFLKTFDRLDIISDLFSMLLDAFREGEASRVNNPFKTFHFLQLILAMQTFLSNGKSSKLLCKPFHVISFIKYILNSRHDYSIGAHSERRMTSTSENSDSDDDTPGEIRVSPDEEMTEVALNLLLSVLEADENLSARTEPELNDVFDLLEYFARGESAVLSRLAREARMVMTARLASASASCLNSEEEESHSSIYQKALKLLQDPILPVRAHGLLLLRQLVTQEMHIDPALIPAILDIFLQSIQEDDSYLFLNGVQGLAAMVDTFGKMVLLGLIKEYADGLEGLKATTLTQRSMDARLRVGEALASAIRRCGETLGSYVDVFLPPLIKLLRSKDIPTVLRMSAISLLTECEKTSSPAMLPYVTDLVDSMVDLLQIETVVLKATGSEWDNTRSRVFAIDEAPTTNDPKLPPFRRAAANFLLVVVQQAIKQAYDSTIVVPPVAAPLKRARIVMAYIASTDEDGFLRLIAKDICEELGQLARAVLDM